MTIYVTSDLHFRHDKIIQVCNRPTTPEEHDAWLIRQINKTVKTHDTVYHLGDFSFTKNIEDMRNFCNRLNGSWIHVLGNHDDEKRIRKAFEGTRHTIAGNYHELKYNGRFIMMLHYPMESWNRKRYGSLHLFGHLHTKEIEANVLKPLKNRKLMSLDSHPEFIPYKLDDIMEEFPVEKKEPA